MGSAVGEGLIAAARLAVLQEAPLIVIPASGGARMQEGILSLMQMPRSIIAVDEVQGSGAALYRAADRSHHRRRQRLLRHAGRHRRSPSPARVIGFAGARVIEETIREKLPEGFQRAEYLLRARHGRHGRAARRAARHADPHRRSAAPSRRRPPRWSASPCPPAATVMASLASTKTAHDSDLVLERLTSCIPRSSICRWTAPGGCSTRWAIRERRLPPVIHVAGTNGKGSVIAYLRAMLEAAGYRVHVYTSPHLVRFHERIRLAGELIEEEALLDAARGMRAGQWRASRSPSSRSPPRRLPRLRPHAGRYPAAGDRPGRAARCDQCDRAAAGDGADADLLRPYAASRRHAGARSPSRRPASSSAACPWSWRRSRPRRWRSSRRAPPSSRRRFPAMARNGTRRAAAE